MRIGPRRAPEATGRGGCGDILYPPEVPLLWVESDYVADSLHSNAAGYAAALQPSTSSPEAFGPLLAAEMVHGHNSIQYCH